MLFERGSWDFPQPTTAGTRILSRRNTWADNARVLRSRIWDRKPITVDNQRCRAFLRLACGKSKRGSGSFQAFRSALGLVLKSRGRQRPYEDGGSADSVPDTSSHRCRLLLPSGMNGPPFFRNFRAAKRNPWSGYTRWGILVKIRIEVFFMAHTTEEKKKLLNRVRRI